MHDNQGWTSYGLTALACGVTLEVKQLKGEKLWKASVVAAVDVSAVSAEDSKRKLAEVLRRAAAELESLAG